MNTATANTYFTADATALLADSIAHLRYYDIAAMSREAKGEALGFDFNRKFAGPGSKARFAQWAVENLDNATLADLLPKFEETARKYYQTKPPKAAGPQIVTAPPIPQDKPGQAVNVEAEADETEQETGADTSDTLARAIDAANKLDESRQVKILATVRADIAQALGQARPILVTVNNGGAITSKILPRQHMHFDKLLKLSAVRNAKGNGLNIWLTGPAGSGKTTAAENVADALNLAFHFSGALDNEYKLLGFIDAGGRCIRTAFREAFEHGGVFLLDEVDGCNASALLALNAALANGYCDFPDGQVKRHKDCVIIAAANTWGQGATHEYVGRAKLDAASLDRFVMMAWPYDEALERDTCGHEAWARKVQAWRSKIMAQGIKAILSPRASYDGASLLANGFTEADVIELVVRKGLTPDQWSQVSGRY